MLVKSNFSYNLYDLKNVPKDPNLNLLAITYMVKKSYSHSLQFQLI
mgnify:CR=1 FL=1